MQSDVVFMMRSSDQEDNKSMMQTSKLFQPKRKAMEPTNNQANKQKDKQTQQFLIFVGHNTPLLWDIDDMTGDRSYT